MTDSVGDARPQEGVAGASGPTSPMAPTAGAMIRHERERQGVHIAMLAAAIKVSPRKLDALENDRHDELPDATFTRALAQTVCRALKMDAAPVLAKLPQAGPSTPLEHVSAGLNTPFREKPGLADAALAMPSRPWAWAGAALLVAALAVVLWPTPEPGRADSAAAPAGPSTTAAPADAVTTGVAPQAAQPAASAVEGAASAVAPAVETVHAAPAPDPALGVGKGATVATTDASWIEVIDGGGQTLLSRIVQPGETVNVDGALPLRLKIGNARATQLVFRGQPVELDAFTRDNIARVELK